MHVSHCTLAFVALSALSATTALAQVNSSASTVTLTATLPESVSLSATPNALTFTLVPGGAAVASAPVSISTSWTLAATRSALHVYAWFSNPAAALSDGASPANTIPSSAVLGQVTSGTPVSFVPFNQSNALGTAAGGLDLLDQALSSTNRSGSRSDNLNLKIDLSSLPQLPAGTYTGTLTLQLQSL